MKSLEVKQFKLSLKRSLLTYDEFLNMGNMDQVYRALSYYDVKQVQIFQTLKRFQYIIILKIAIDKK